MWGKEFHNQIEPTQLTALKPRLAFCATQREEVWLVFLPARNREIVATVLSSSSLKREFEDILQGLKYLAEKSLCTDLFHNGVEGKTSVKV